MKRSVIALAAFAVLAAPGSMSCSTTPSGSQSTSMPSTPPPAPKPVAHVGDTLELNRIGNGTIAVTLVQVINPATVPQGIGEDPSKTRIATKLKITNTGKSTIVGDANNNVAVIGSDDHSYSADFADVTECTNFVYGQFLLAPDESTTGCVVFTLPPGITPAKVKYMPSSGISHDVGEWLNP
jgi:hypothetical protein